tara:strand:+ start:159 stop:482 length:324 start_codon:yes stop_codon:yes gene_type:complete
MNDDIVRKVTQTINRENGDLVEITVSQDLFGHNNFTVREKKRDSDVFHVCSMDMPHNVKTMPRSEYIKKGRPEAFRVAKIGEILKLSQWLGRPMKEFNEAFNTNCHG